MGRRDERVVNGGDVGAGVEIGVDLTREQRRRLDPV